MLIELDYHLAYWLCQFQFQVTPSKRATLNWKDKFKGHILINFVFWLLMERNDVDKSLENKDNYRKSRTMGCMIGVHRVNGSEEDEVRVIKWDWVLMPLFLKNQQAVGVTRGLHLSIKKHRCSLLSTLNKVYTSKKIYHNLSRNIFKLKEWNWPS